MKKLAIVGSHKDTRDLAPYDDKSYEIWVFNEAAHAEWCRRWTGCFQLHRPEIYTSPENFMNKDHWDWLQKDHGDGKQIFMQEADPHVPNSVAYPLETIQSIFFSGFPTYLRSTPDYALALSLLRHYDRIDVWGVELNSNSEYSYQSESWRYWVGYARGSGANLVLHSGLHLFQAKLYGYQGDPTVPVDFYQERARELEGTWKQNDKVLRDVKAAIDQAMLKREFDEVAALTLQAQEVALACGEAAGALGQAQSYAGLTRPVPRQEYEMLSAKAQRKGEEDRAAMYYDAGKCEYVWNVWSQTGRIEALNQLRTFTGQQLRHAYDCGVCLGIHRENLLYIADLDGRIEAAGGMGTLAAISPELIPVGVDLASVRAGREL